MVMVFTCFREMSPDESVLVLEVLREVVGSFVLTFCYVPVVQLLTTSKTRLGCGTKSMLTYLAADIVKLYEIISNDALILRQKAD